MRPVTRPYSQPTSTARHDDTPLHIGFFTDTYAPQINGISISLQLLTASLREAGHRVTIFAPHYPHFRDTDPDVHRIPAVPYLQEPAFYISLPGTPRISLALRRCEFDILHIHSPLSTGAIAYLAAKAKRTPLIYTYHTAITDYVHYLGFGANTRPVRGAARWFSTATANLTDRVVTPSAKTRELLLRQRVKRPIQVIPNGIELGSFQRPVHAHSFRSQLGLASDALLLLSVGRLAPEKNLPLLVDAFSGIAARFPQAHLVFAGDGSSRAGLEQQAAASPYANRIHFLGMVQPALLPGLLHEADLFLSASVSETQCVAMAEAIASGLPVVAVRDEAFAGMLVDSRNGLIVPGDAPAFAAGVCTLLSDPARRRQFGAQSLELSRSFSIEAQALSLVQLYREVIREKSTARRKRRFLSIRPRGSTFERKTR